MKRKRLKKCANMLLASLLVCALVSGINPVYASEGNGNTGTDTSGGTPSTGTVVSLSDEAPGTTQPGTAAPIDRQTQGTVPSGETPVPGNGQMQSTVTPGDTPSSAKGPAVEFVFEEDQNGSTALYLTEGVPVDEAALLAGLTVRDENGAALQVIVTDTGGLDMGNPTQIDPANPVPYIITYAALHPTTGDVCTTVREAFVVRWICLWRH